MKKYFIVFVLIFCFGANLSAQRRVIVYDSYDTREGKSQKEEKNLQNNMEWNISLLGRGAFVLTYERKVNQHLGIEIGAGPTMYYDFMFYAFNNDYNSQLSDYEDVSYKLGYYVSVSTKIYPKAMVDFDGPYFAPIFRYRSYNYESTVVTHWGYDEPSYSEKTYDQSMKASEFGLMIGYQREGWSGIFCNSYVGFGWSSKEYDHITYNAYTDQYMLKNKRKSGPIFLMGFSLGFTF